MKRKNVYPIKTFRFLLRTGKISFNPAGVLDIFSLLHNIKLMDDNYSYWFRYRSIPWYRIRRIKGESPKETIEKALGELQIETIVWRKDQRKQSSYWVIEPK